MTLRRLWRALQALSFVVLFSVGYGVGLVASPIVEGVAAGLTARRRSFERIAAALGVDDA